MLDFTKYPVFIFGLNGTTSGFGLGELPDANSRDPEELFKSWVTVNWTLWNPAGGVVKGPFRFGTGGREVVCMSSFPDTAGSNGMASCLLFHQTWRAQFIGNGRDVDTFFGVVREASIVQGGRLENGKTKLPCCRLFPSRQNSDNRGLIKNWLRI